MTARRRCVAVAVATLACLALTSCNLDPRTATLPGGTGTGDDGFTVTALFTSADNLVPNSEVQYNDVRVGTVRQIDLDRKTWQARVKFSVGKNVPDPGQRARRGRAEEPARRRVHPAVPTVDRRQSAACARTPSSR